MLSAIARLAPDGVRPVGEQAHHLRGRFQVPLGVGLQPVAGARDGCLGADAGQDVLQGPAIGGVVEDVVGGHDRQPVGARDRVQPVDPRPVVATVAVAGGDVAQPRQGLHEARQPGLEAVESAPGTAISARSAPASAVSMSRLRSGRPWPATRRRHRPSCPRQQRRQPTVGGAGPRVGQELRPVEKGQPAAVSGRIRAALAAACRRTTPASVFRSAMPSAWCPWACAVSTRLTASEAPRRNEKAEATPSSTNGAGELGAAPSAAVWRLGGWGPESGMGR